MNDPIRGGDNILVMCEVFNADGSVHESNKRAALREVAEKYADQDAWFGIEQEYTFFDGIKPLGWPDNGFPAPKVVIIVALVQMKFLVERLLKIICMHV